MLGGGRGGFNIRGEDYVISGGKPIVSYISTRFQGYSCFFQGSFAGLEFAMSGSAEASTCGAWDCRSQRQLECKPVLFVGRSFGRGAGYCTV